MGVSSSTVLRFGYVAVIVILVFSTFQAYRIQGSFRRNTSVSTGSTSSRMKHCRSWRARYLAGRQ